MASEGVEEPGTAQGRPADTDTLGLRAARRRTVAWCVGLAAALVVTLVVGVGAGPVGVAPGDSASILWSHLTGLVTGRDGVAAGVRGDTIIWTIRVPRVVLGAAVGRGSPSPAR